MGIKNGRATSGNTEYTFNNPPSDFVGKIVEMHTFNGTVPIPRGYMKCDGSIINQTNYDAVHGAGAYVQDNISASILLGKYVPDMVNKYSVGASSTTATGASAIPSVGQTNHQITIAAHTHTAPSHNHRFLDYTNEDETKTYNSSGSAITLLSISDNTNPSDNEMNLGFVTQNQTGVYYPIADLYTDNQAGTTSSNGGSVQNIQPESIQVIKLIRVI